MRFDELDNNHKGYVEQVAHNRGLDPYALWEAYLDTMESNFEQDIVDVANDNEDYLREKGLTCE